MWTDTRLYLYKLLEFVFFSMVFLSTYKVCMLDASCLGWNWELYYNPAANVHVFVFWYILTAYIATEQFLNAWKLLCHYSFVVLLWMQHWYKYFKSLFCCLYNIYMSTNVQCIWFLRYFCYFYYSRLHEYFFFSSS